MKFKSLVAGMGLAVTLPCSAIDYPKHEEGYFWCSNQIWNTKNFTASELSLAKKGYLYSLAAALALQEHFIVNNDHFFYTPPRMQWVDHAIDRRSGFEAKTFALYTNETRSELVEVIIAFTGSQLNDFRKDWLLTNFLSSAKQHKKAVEYVHYIKSIPEFTNAQLVVAGYSLGGALAAHVAKNQETGHYVHEAWLFNPSFKTKADTVPDKKIWLATTRHDGLKKLSKVTKKYKLGAPPEQIETDYHLVDSNSLYAHYRWVLARTLLFVADIAIKDAEGLDHTEPLNILKKSKFTGCKAAYRDIDEEV